MAVERSAQADRAALVAAPLRDALLSWYDQARRDLPWRRTRDPYAIWISEIMAQQTRVDTVIPYYERWLARFPDVAALAGATEEDVFELWQGLGYYSRARNLLRAARVVVDEHGGALPESADGLRTLPGVGRYTAGAVASIAHGESAPVVDGNVVRVFSRLFDIRDDVRATKTQRLLWEIATELVPDRRPGAFNQALMELGALVCTPKTPACGSCPVGDLCAGRAHAAELPFKKPKPKPRDEHRYAFLLRDDRERILLGRNPSGTLLGGMWQYPMIASDETPDAALRALADTDSDALVTLEPVKHVFSHIRMRVTPVRAAAGPGAAQVSVRGYDEQRWVEPGGFDGLALSTLMRKLAARFEEGR